MSEELKPSRPTHELKLLDTSSGDTAIVGVAWAKENGTISLKLNPGVVLSYDNLKGKYLTLFRTRTEEEWAAHHAAKKKREEEDRQNPSQPEKYPSWKEKYPDYVRKIHWNYATRRECPNRSMGHPEVSDDAEAVTCGKCKKALQARGKVVPLNPTPEKPPEEPPPAA